jgi:hypothetical protein
MFYLCYHMKIIYNKKTTIMMATIAILLSLASIIAVLATEADAQLSPQPPLGSGGHTGDGGGAGRGSGGHTGVGSDGGGGGSGHHPG